MSHGGKGGPGRAIRSIVAVAVVAGTLGAGPAAGSVSRGAAGEAARPTALELYPNLQTLRPHDVFVQRLPQYRRLLRLSNEVVNAATGPLEVYPVASDCDEDGDPSNDRAGNQRYFQDQNGDGYFTRGVDTKQASRFAGCFTFHPEHGHWHFENFARYDLARLSDGRVVASNTKVTFCLADVHLVLPELPGSPSSGYYGASCGQDSTQGISVGWSDEYTAATPGQWIDVTRVRNGDYCLVSTADPANLLKETDETDNQARVAVNLYRTTVTVLDRPC